MSNTHPTPAEVSETSKRVLALSPDARNMLLMGLVGRLLVTDLEALQRDIVEVEELDAEMNTEQANDRDPHDFPGKAEVQRLIDEGVEL